jgi:hypothetical protein
MTIAAMAVYPKGEQKMRNLLIVLSVLLLPVGAARAEVNVGIGISVPGVSIGINMPAYPRLVPIPGYPVYYDPRVDVNFFFYDGLYWVFQGNDWYMSGWYNGPWQLVEPAYVPVYVLRIPVRYYRSPPPYFRGWRADAPPRWGEYWGRDWERNRKGWDHWDRHSTPRRAPLPSYQRRYSGERYPREFEQQRSIGSERYRYQPREPMTQQYFQQQRRQGGQQNMERGNRHEGRDQDRDR